MRDHTTILLEFAAPEVRLPWWPPLLGAALGAGLHIATGGPWQGVTGIFQAAVLGALLLAAAESDLRTGRIPNEVVLVSGLVAVGLSFASPFPGFGSAVSGALAGGGICFGARLLGHALFRRPGMGLGDAKLAAVIGLLVGLPVLWALYMAVLLGGAAAAPMLFLRDRPPRATIAFAPFIAIGTLGAVFVLPAHTLSGWLLRLGGL